MLYVDAGHYSIRLYNLDFYYTERCVRYKRFNSKTIFGYDALKKLENHPIYRTADESLLFSGYLESRERAELLYKIFQTKKTLHSSSASILHNLGDEVPSHETDVLLNFGVEKLTLMPGPLAILAYSGVTHGCVASINAKKVSTVSVLDGNAIFNSVNFNMNLGFLNTWKALKNLLWKNHGVSFSKAHNDIAIDYILRKYGVAIKSELLNEYEMQSKLMNKHLLNTGIVLPDGRVLQLENDQSQVFLDYFCPDFGLPKMINESLSCLDFSQKRLVLPNIKISGGLASTPEFANVLTMGTLCENDQLKYTVLNSCEDSSIYGLQKVASYFSSNFEQLTCSRHELNEHGIKRALLQKRWY